MALNTLMMKPGEIGALPGMQTVYPGATFTVENGDNGILLVLYAENDGEVRVTGGDGVFGGGDKVIDLVAEEYTFVYLESGPYMQHSGDYKGMIRVMASNSYVRAAVIQLV